MESLDDGSNDQEIIVRSFCCLCKHSLQLWLCLLPHHTLVHTCSHTKGGRKDYKLWAFFLVRALKSKVWHLVLEISIMSKLCGDKARQASNIQIYSTWSVRKGLQFLSGIWNDDKMMVVRHYFYNCQWKLTATCIFFLAMMHQLFELEVVNVTWIWGRRTNNLVK